MAFADRNSRIMVLLSSDARSFKQAYQHDGTIFGGQPDNHPLSVPLQGRTARYVRLQLPGHSYFHLDEVEVYAVNGKENLALDRPATQSSVSQWSVAHGKPNAASKVADWSSAQHPVGPLLERGFKLAENLRKLGASIDAEEKALREAAARQLAADASPSAQAKAYFEARWAVRRLALRNPLLDFDSILFVKHAPGRFPHMSDQFYGWWSRPGGGVFVLEGFKGDRPKLRCLTASFAEGSFVRPDLSYDGKKVLFAYAKYYAKVADLADKANKANLPEDAFFHVYEANLDGSGIRQLTHGRYDDFDAHYLPGGDIVFLSTRKGVFLQCSKANTQQTIESDLPDSYVRCGGDNYRPVPVFTLHRMNAAGSDMHPISAFENFEWTPSVAADGRILYTRWDYIDRFNGHFFSLWSTNPDGTNPQLVYGNYTTRPQVKFEARSIPGSHRLICTAGAHHSNVGGSLILLDRNLGTEEAAPVVRLTPEVPFPETEAFVESYYANPYPLSEQHYLVAWSDRHLPPHCRVDDTNQNPINATGLYLLDAFGNLDLIYRDPAISSECPIPVRARPVPPVHADTVAWDGPQEGRFFLQDVYAGLPGVPRGTIQQLRIVAVPPKVQPQMNSPSLGVSAEDPGKFVLGTVPVEADGSASFRAPSGIPVFFQALDRPRPGGANDAEPDVRAAGPDALLHRLPRVARGGAAARPGPGGVVARAVEDHARAPRLLAAEVRRVGPARARPELHFVPQAGQQQCRGRPLRPDGNRLLRQPAELRRGEPEEPGLRARPLGAGPGRRAAEQALVDADRPETARRGPPGRRQPPPPRHLDGRLRAARRPFQRQAGRGTAAVAHAPAPMLRQ